MRIMVDDSRGTEKGDREEGTEKGGQRRGTGERETRD